MSTNPIPRRVEWRGPESWLVWADEDGVHVRSARGDALEMPDVQRLFDLWTQARAVTTAGEVPAPRPLTPEERQAIRVNRDEEFIQRRAVRALEAEFGPTTTPS